MISSTACLVLQVGIDLEPSVYVLVFNCMSYQPEDKAYVKLLDLSEDNPLTQCL